MPTMARVAVRCSLCCLLGSASVAFGQGIVPPLPPAVAAAADASPAQPAPPIGPSSRALSSDLFQPLASDFKQLVSTRNLLIAGVGVGAAAVSHPWDRRVAASGWGSSVDDVFEPGQLVGGFLLQTGLALGTYTVGRTTNHERLAILGSHLFRAQVVAQTTTQTIKLAARRTRPDGTPLSFPSGHSAAAFATASVLQSDFGWKLGAPAYAVATWVAASRVQMKRHYVSDVVAGATVGLLAGRSVTVGRGSARFALSPTVVPGGVGITALKIENR